MNILKKITRKIANYINRVKAIKPVCKEIKKSMDHFLSDKEKNNSLLRWSIGWDIWRCRWKYQSTPNEYFLFGFRGKGHDYRNSFITDIVKDNTLLSLIGGDLFRKELKNKYSFYQILGKFFNREAIFVDFTDNADQIKFKRFALSHKDIFVKENASSCGRGVSCCHITSVH